MTILAKTPKYHIESWQTHLVISWLYVNEFSVLMMFFTIREQYEHNKPNIKSLTSILRNLKTHTNISKEYQPQKTEILKYASNPIMHGIIFFRFMSAFQNTLELWNPISRCVRNLSIGYAWRSPKSVKVQDTKNTQLKRVSIEHYFWVVSCKRSVVKPCLICEKSVSKSPFSALYSIYSY